MWRDTARYCRSAAIDIAISWFSIQLSEDTSSAYRPDVAYRRIGIICIAGRSFDHHLESISGRDTDDPKSVAGQHSLNTEGMQGRRDRRG